MSSERDVLIPQRHRTDSFPGRREVGVEHGGCRYADRRLADATPEAAARHDDRLHLRHLADAHRIVGIEVGLLDAAVLNGAPAIEQRRQAVDKRAGNLAFDLRRIDDIARVGGGNDAMHLDLVAIDDRDFRRTGNVTGIAHVLRDAAIDPLRRWFVPADFFGDGIEYGKVLRMLRHQLAPELDRILAHRMRQFIHETFEVDRVVIDVHAAPVTRRDVGIAHRMLDQKIGNRISDRGVAGSTEALECGRIHAVDQCLGAQAELDGLSRQSYLQCGQIVVRVEGAGQFTLRDGMILAVLHVFFARPQQFDRGARHLLGDSNRLPDIVGLAATAKAAAEYLLVDVAFIGWQTGCFQHRGESGLAVLRSAPDLAFVRGIERRGVQRLHRGVILVRVIVHRLELLGGARDGSLGVAILVADEGWLRGIKTLLEPFRDRRARDLGVVAFVPNDRQGFKRGLGVPPGVGDDGDGAVADPHHLLDALQVHDFGFVEAFQFAAEYRAVLDRGIEHARQLDVDAVRHLAGDLVSGVEALDAFADELPVLRILQLDVRRRLEPGCGFDPLAIGRRASGRRMGDDAVGGGTFRSRYLPIIRSSLDQHRARGGTALAHIFLRGSDAAAAAGREIAPCAFARHALARRRKFGGDFRPVAFEFFGDKLGEAGKRTLAHFRSRDANDDGG